MVSLQHVESRVRQCTCEYFSELRIVVHDQDRTRPGWQGLLDVHRMLLVAVCPPEFDCETYLGAEPTSHIRGLQENLHQSGIRFAPYR